MNALTPTRASSGALAPAGLVPRDFDQALRLAEMMARSQLVPQHLQQKPADCLLVVEQAMRWNMSPFAVAQGTFVTKGKLGYSGTLMHAAVEQNAPVAGHLNYVFTGEGETRAVIVRGTMIGESQPREVEVKLRDARTENVWWKKTPDQMLCYHGARVWARRHTPGVIFGAYSREELVDALEEPQQAPRDVPNLAEPPARPLSEAVAAAQEKLEVVAPSGTVHAVPPGRWLAAVQKALGGLEDAAALNKWHQAMLPILMALADRHGDLVEQANRAFLAREAELAPEEEFEPGSHEPPEEEA